MAEVKWTEQASNDLQAITEFIAHDSPEYACLFATDVLDVVDRISVFPKIGRVVPEVANPNVREITFSAITGLSIGCEDISWKSSLCITVPDCLIHQH